MQTMTKMKTTAVRLAVDERCTFTAAHVLQFHEQNRVSLPFAHFWFRPRACADLSRNPKHDSRLWTKKKPFSFSVNLAASHLACYVNHVVISPTLFFCFLLRSFICTTFPPIYKENHFLLRAAENKFMRHMFRMECFPLGLTLTRGSPFHPKLNI